MSTFTQEEIDALYAPFPLADHITREGNTVRDGAGIQWFTYIDRAAVQRRLEKLFPGEWSVDIIETHRDAKYVTVSLKMTIRGISRSCNGGQSLNGQRDQIDEDKEKGAWTEAFRRVASVWGIGLYLYESDFKNYTDNYVDGSGKKDWKKRDAVQDEAEKKFAAWYQRQFPQQNGTKPSPPTQPAPAPSQNGAHEPAPANDHQPAMLMLSDLIDSPDLIKEIPQENHRRATVNLLAKNGLFAKCETTPDMLKVVAMYIKERAKDTPQEKSADKAVDALKRSLLMTA